MTKKVWLSLMLQDTTLIKFAKPDKVFTKRIFEERGGYPHSHGTTITEPQDIPSDFFGTYPDKNVKKLTDLVTLGGYICVSERLKVILSEFNLSGATFHPVNIFEHDRKTPVSNEFYFLNFGKRFDVVIPEASSGLKRRFEDKEEFKIHAGYKDKIANYSIRLRGRSIPNSDMWSDLRVHESVFLSDKLVQRLKAEKLDKLFKLRSCEVAE